MWKGKLEWVFEDVYEVKVTQQETGEVIVAVIETGKLKHTVIWRE